MPLCMEFIDTTQEYVITKETSIEQTIYEKRKKRNTLNIENERDREQDSKRE